MTKSASARSDVVLVVVAEMLEVAEADEAGRHACQHRRGLDAFAPHRQRRAGHAQRACRRDAQRMHRFGTQELADRRAQHRTAIAHARIGRQAAALELQLEMPVRRIQLAQPQRAAIAQLAGPGAELMAAVDTGQAAHAGPRRVAAEHLQRAPVRALPPVAGQAEQLRAAIAYRHPVRVGQGLRLQFGVETRAKGVEAVRPDQAIGPRAGLYAGGSQRCEHRRECSQRRLPQEPRGEARWALSLPLQSPARSAT